MIDMEQWQRGLKALTQYLRAGLIMEAAGPSTPAHLGDYGCEGWTQQEVDEYNAWLAEGDPQAAFEILQAKNVVLRALLANVGVTYIPEWGADDYF